MTCSASNVANYDFTADDELFLDTNIWLFIHGSQKPSDEKTSIYSTAFRRILEAKSRIYIDILIVSEYINVYVRQRARLVSNVQFKTFRNTPEFKPIAQDAAKNSKLMLDSCLHIENRFRELDINTMVNEYAGGRYDFNDLVIEGLCKNRGLKLITDDGDFKDRGISVLTANKNLLN